MRDLIVLAEPEEIEAHYASLWRTDHFRESHQDPYGYVRHLVCRVAQVPRLFFTMDRPEIEHPHFTPWAVGATHYRTYDRDSVHDLFWLHEMVHQIGLASLYDPHSSWEAWAERIILNENATALESEVYVYQALPGLRAHTFPQEIWADRYLGRPPMPRQELFRLRQQALRDPKDPIEQQMAGYPHQNREWAELWRHRWHEAEAAMQRLVRGARQHREAAARSHVEWLLNDTGMTPERPYPFPDEAEAFATIFWRNKAAGVIPPDTGSGDGPI